MAARAQPRHRERVGAAIRPRYASRLAGCCGACEVWCMLPSRRTPPRSTFATPRQATCHDVGARRCLQGASPGTEVQGRSLNWCGHLTGLGRARAACAHAPRSLPQVLAPCARVARGLRARGGRARRPGALCGTLSFKSATAALRGAALTHAWRAPSLPSRSQGGLRARASVFTQPTVARQQVSGGVCARLNY